MLLHRNDTQWEFLESRQRGKPRSANVNTPGSEISIQAKGVCSGHKYWRQQLQSEASQIYQPTRKSAWPWPVAVWLDRLVDGTQPQSHSSTAVA